MTTKYHKASFLEPEEAAAVLIDFGRGQTTERSSGDPEESATPELVGDAKAQDVYDYGALLGDLTRFWMKKTGRTTVPPVLVNIIAKCTGEENRIRMRQVVDMWEIWAVEKVAELELPEFVQAAEAWQVLRLHQSQYSTTRSVPSSPKPRRIYSDFSSESLLFIS